MYLKPADPVCEILEQAAVACKRATSLASQLLTFGKGGAPVRKPTPLAGVVKDAVDLARAGAHVTIDLAIDGDLWSAEIDIEQISQALHNILLNARQAMPEGGIIEVRAENVVFDANSFPLRTGRYVMISVRDHGCGIAADVLPRIFDPYFTTKRNGSGLGLATVHAIVAKHGGHITVQSMLGLETTVSIYLPACATAQPAGICDWSAAANRLGPNSGDGRRRSSAQPADRDSETTRLRSRVRSRGCGSNRAVPKSESVRPWF